MAEQFVLNYETSKLKEFSGLPQNCVQQVSMNFVNAGYDIESFNKEAAVKNIYEKIFIEVKCVNSDYLFYWSRNEIKKAEEFRAKYFLYLVPKAINEAGLRIIQDPFINVLKSDSWVQEIDQLQIREKNFEQF